MTNHEGATRPVAKAGPPVNPESVAHPVITECGTGSCPTVYSTDRDTVLIQGNAVAGLTVPDGELIVEIPRSLLLEAARRIQDNEVQD